MSIILTTAALKALDIATEKTLKKTIDLTSDFFKTNKIHYKQENLPEIFKNHYKEAFNWSSDIPFIGLNKNKKVSESTIELSISSKFSKYDKKKKKKNTFTELEIINSNSNVLIVGSPGAGKTTTIKRLIGMFFSSQNEKINYTNPILLRLKDIDDSSNIYMAVMEVFDFPCESRQIETTKRVTKKNGDFEIVKSTYIKNYFKGTEIPIESFIPTFLNETNSILFLDGYDELPESIQKQVIDDIEKLGLKLDKSKIILTSRTSSISKKIFSRFDSFEINPLTTEEIEEIATKWLSNSLNFLTELNKSKYSDIANRPIYLTLLLILFDNNNALPSSPFEVYREAVFLIIKDWDEHRGIKRISKYANFNVRKKLDFLQEISFYLTYQLKNNTFNSEQLSEVYSIIHKKYDLPLQDMSKVVTEIESHNGLISETGFNTFEFSHPSLQEYLCAECLISLPYSKNTILYFHLRPDPLAIAVCISKDSGLWLANLLLNENISVSNISNKSNFEEQMIKFLTRLIEERPLFNESVELGLTLIYLISKFHKSNKIFELTTMLLKIKNVKESLILTLNHFNVNVNEVHKKCYLKRKSVLAADSLIKVPNDEVIDLNEWNIIQKYLKE